MLCKAQVADETELSISHQNIILSMFSCDYVVHLYMLCCYVVMFMLCYVFLFMGQEGGRQGGEAAGEERAPSGAGGLHAGAPPLAHLCAAVPAGHLPGALP